MSKVVTKLSVNGRSRELAIEQHWTLAFVLRTELGLTGTKVACSGGECGACTVLVGGKPVPSCMVLAVEVEEQDILTIEGLSNNEKLHPVQKAWLAEYGTQCGFCSPGMILSTVALLAKNPHPTDTQIKNALAGNICVCSNYEHIIASVKTAAEMMDKQEE